MQPGEVKVHELAGIEAVLVRVEGYDAAELNFKIPASVCPLEPLLPGGRITLLLVHVLPRGGERLSPSVNVAQDHDVHRGHPEEVVVCVVMARRQLQEDPVQSWI